MRRSPSKKLSMSTDKVYLLDPFSNGKGFDSKNETLGQFTNSKNFWKTVDSLVITSI